jgi:translation initiation factor eIF-2B subunit alpha
LQYTPLLNGQRYFLAPLDVVSSFRDLTSQYPDMSATIAAIKAISIVIECSTGTITAKKANTMTEFTIELESATQTLLDAMKHSVSLLAGCELFKRLVTRTAGDTIEVGQK